jgi:hypothetical protein
LIVTLNKKNVTEVHIIFFSLFMTDEHLSNLVVRSS